MKATLASIRQKLVAVRTAVRMLYIFDGMLKVVVGIILLLACGFLLDRLLEFPRLMRVALLGTQLGLAGLLVWRVLIYPIRVRISIEDIAGQVELRNPFLKDRLISALQLERQLKDPEYGDSRQLTQAVIREAEELAGGIKFYNILHPRPVLVTAILTLLLCGSATGACLFWSQQAKIWALRNLLLADVSWPRENEIHLIRRTFQVTRGTSLQVRFLFETLPETDTPIELRVLELVDNPADQGLKSAGARRQGLKNSETKRPLEASKAVRYTGDAAALTELIKLSPGTLYYQERSIPLVRKDVPEGVALEASLPPSSKPLLFFLRAETVRKTPLFTVRFERILTPFYEALPVRRAKQSQVALVPLPDTSIYVPRGHNLKLQAVVFGPILRDKTTIRYKLKGVGQQQSDLLSAIERGNRFAYEDFVEVSKELEFQLATGDKVEGGPTYNVRVRVPPEAQWHKIELVYPSYLGRKPAPELAGTNNRDFLETPLGTRFQLRVTGEFSQPRLERGQKPVAVPFAAWLRFSQGLRTEISLEQVGDPVDVKERPGRVHVTFKGSFMATHDTGFFFRMRGPNRLHNEDARHYQVSVRADSPPGLLLKRPSGSGQPYYLATRDASIRMILKTLDDHGLGRVVLRYRLDGETDYRETELKKAKYQFKQKYQAGEAPLGEPRDKTFTFPWELESVQKLKVGDKIHYHFLAEDYAPFEMGEEGQLVLRNHGNRTYLRSGYSEHRFIKDRTDYRILIVTKLEMVQHLNEQLLMLRREVVRLLKTQSDIKKTTVGYTKNKAYSANDLDQIFRLELRQNDLQRATREQIRGPLMRIQELYRENHLKPGTDVGEMVRLASAVVLDLSPSAGKLLKTAQATNDAAFQRESLTDAVTIQDRILRHFRSMLDEMQKWEDLSEVIQEAQELLNFQKQLNSQTKTLKRR